MHTRFYSTKRALIISIVQRAQNEFKYLNQFCIAEYRHAYIRCDISSICEISYRAILLYFPFVACENFTPRLSRSAAKRDRLISTRFFDSAREFILKARLAKQFSFRASHLICRSPHLFFKIGTTVASPKTSRAAPECPKYFRMKLSSGKKRRERGKKGSQSRAIKWVR